MENFLLENRFYFTILPQIPVLADIHADQRIEHIEFNGKTLRIHPECRIYFTTKLPNPRLPASVYSNLLVINFNTTESTLEQRLLTHVIESEKPDNERQRQTLINADNENKLSLEKLEQNLLNRIATTKEIISDSPELIALFESTKQGIGELLQKIDAATVAYDEIARIRQPYTVIAKKATQLYFLLNALSSINHMYQFSLDHFLHVFAHALASDAGGKSNESAQADQRIGHIIQQLCRHLYRFGCVGLFEEDKLLFAFQITTKMALCDGLLQQSEIDFFIRGAEYGTPVEPEQNRVKWLTITDWKCIKTLEACFADKFISISQHIVDHSTEWRRWFELQYPENGTLPGDFHAKLNDFEVRYLPIITVQPASY